MSAPTDWFALAKEICVPDPRARDLELEERKTLDSSDSPQQTQPRAPDVLRLPRG